jgi:hypothetical protein
MVVVPEATVMGLLNVIVPLQVITYVPPAVIAACRALSVQELIFVAAVAADAVPPVIGIATNVTPATIAATRLVNTVNFGFTIRLSRTVRIKCDYVGEPTP